MATDDRLIIEDSQDRFTGPQIAALRHMGMTQASVGDLQVFFDYAQTYGLDPFTEEITMVGRHGRQFLQTDIDGLLTIAEHAAVNAGKELAVGMAEFQTPDRRYWIPSWPVPNHPVWADEDHPPAAAHVSVVYDFQTFEGVAAFTEYLARDEERWKVRPSQWLANIAAALALREALPDVLGIIYLNEEMRAADEYTPGRSGNDYGTMTMSAGPGKGKKEK